MRDCHSAAARARPVVTAPYGPKQNRFVPLVVPVTCPWNDGLDVRCSIAHHHWRERKYGPAVLVLECEVHEHAFTLYPLGQVPYGRSAVAPVNAEGDVVRTTPRPTRSANDNAALAALDRVAWRATVFGAAVDAADKGVAPWPRELSSERTQLTWEVQQARLARGARILGIAPAPSPRQGEQIANVLSIPRLAMRDAERAWKRAVGYRERGPVLASLLARLPRARRVLDCILGAGALAGVWGPVTRWQKGARGRPARARRFPSCGTGFG